MHIRSIPNHLLECNLGGITILTYDDDWKNMREEKTLKFGSIDGKIHNITWEYSISACMLNVSGNMCCQCARVGILYCKYHITNMFLDSHLNGVWVIS